MKNSVNIRGFADDLQNYIDNNRINKPKTIAKTLDEIQLIADLTAEMAKEVEFLMAKDINAHTFAKRVQDIKNAFESKLARITG
jgi:ribosomal protein L14E/L6E/L27E